MIDAAGFKLWNSTAMGLYLTCLEPGEMLVEGRGTRVRDSAGRWYLDARSGFWNVTLGYSHPALVEAVKRQVETLPYASLWGYGRPASLAVETAAMLSPHLPGDIDMVKFQSNGAQAVETAALLSRHLHLLGGRPQKNAVVAMWGGFHGFGPGASALTGLPYLHYHAGPLLPEVIHVPGPFAPIGETGTPDLVRVVSDYGPERVSAVVVEPVIGEGGHVLGAEYLRQIADFCREHDIHLIVDEVTTGMGRMGAYTRSEQLGLAPDILTLGKGLTGGYVGMSAVCLSRGLYQQLLDAPVERFFASGSTHDGHPLGLAAATAVIRVLNEEKIFQNVQAQSLTLQTRLEQLAERHESVSAVRGAGLMFAVEFAASGDPWFTNKVRLAMEARGVLVAVLNSVPAIMIIPPLIVSAEEVAEIAHALDGALADLANGWEPAGPPMKGFV
ncbi:aminotransferase family protein [Nonomuraea sp. SYSU D8015]|uniref:aminotransferase family protein n=1 Tax=Nonomuraea sp. SYSU D8015 TaxID=2593644 RepID=UPI0016604B9C|nr:aminotransferase class III-fold pyridoxal phosphate-dependent enzyme [Nonomuraea sp. SYSU D8015]